MFEIIAIGIGSYIVKQAYTLYKAHNSTNYIGTQSSCNRIDDEGIYSKPSKKIKKKNKKSKKKLHKVLEKIKKKNQEFFEEPFLGITNKPICIYKENSQKSSEDIENLKKVEDKNQESSKKVQDKSMEFPFSRTNEKQGLSEKIEYEIQEFYVKIRNEKSEFYEKVEKKNRKFYEKEKWEYFENLDKKREEFYVKFKNRKYESLDEVKKEIREFYENLEKERREFYEKGAKNIVKPPIKYKKEGLVRDIIQEIIGAPFPKTIHKDIINPKTGRHLEIDCYSEMMIVGVENDGYQHDTFPNHFHKTEKDFKCQQYRDKVKDDWFKQNNHLLIRIKEGSIDWSDEKSRESIGKEIDKQLNNYLSAFKWLKLTTYGTVDIDKTIENVLDMLEDEGFDRMVDIGTIIGNFKSTLESSANEFADYPASQSLIAIQAVNNILKDIKNENGISQAA